MEREEFSEIELEQDVRAAANLDELRACLKKHGRLGFDRRRGWNYYLAVDYARQLEKYEQGTRTMANVFNAFKNWILLYLIGPESPSGEPLIGTRQPRRDGPSDKASSASVEQPDPEPSRKCVSSVTERLRATMSR